MGRLRVTVAGLMGLVVALAVGLAALRNASTAWAGTVLLLTLGLLAAAILGAACARGPRRAWWLGFALFGWGYEALTSAPWSSPETLPSHALLGGLYARLSPRKVVAIEPFAAVALQRDGRILDPNPPQGSFQGVALGSDAIVAVGTLDAVAFRAIGHHLLALASAVLGGFIASWFYRSNDRLADGESDPQRTIHGNRSTDITNLHK